MKSTPKNDTHIWNFLLSIFSRKKVDPSKTPNAHISGNYEVICHLYEITWHLHEVIWYLYEVTWHLYEVTCYLYEVTWYLYEVTLHLYENFRTGYLTKNRELNQEVQAWTSWVNQEVIGYTRKLLCYYRKLLFFAGNLLVFTKQFVLSIYHRYLVNINITRLLHWRYQNELILMPFLSLYLIYISKTL